MNVSVKGIEINGINLVSYIDPLFNHCLNIYLTEKDSYSANCDPSSVFVENKTDKNIISCRVNWKIKDSENTVYFPSKDFGVLDKLTKNKSSAENLEIDESNIIKPHSGRVFNSGIFYTTDFGSAGVGSHSNSLISNKRTTNEEEATKKLKDWALKRGLLTDKGWNAAIRNSVNQRTFVSVEVSIDGLLFDDGVFIGPNKTKYFEELIENIQILSKRAQNPKLFSKLIQIRKM